MYRVARYFLFVQLVGHLTLNQKIEFRILGGELCLCSPSGEAADLGSASFAGSTPVTSTWFLDPKDTIQRYERCHGGSSPSGATLWCIA